MTEEIKNQSSGKKFFLLSVFFWVFFLIGFFVLGSINEYTAIVFELSKGDEMAFYKMLGEPFLFLIGIGFCLPYFLALFIGSFLSFQKKNNLFSIQPLIFFIILSIPYTLFALRMASDTLSFSKDLLPLYFILIFSYYFPAFFFQKKKEKLLFKIGAVFLVFILLGYAIGGKVLAKKYTFEKNQFEQNINTLYAQAIRELNPYFCDQMQKLYKMQMEKLPAGKWVWEYIFYPQYKNCITELAKKLNDILLCKKLDLSETNTCLMQVAFKEKVSLCGSQEPYDHCLMKVANRLNDKELCGFIENSNIQNKCLQLLEITQAASTIKSPQKCKESEYAELRNKCIFELAFRMNDPKLCNLIENSNEYFDNGYRIITYNSYWDSDCVNQPFKD